MPHVPGLRSPYAKVGRLVYFGRMLDKIRLQAAGRLPADYQENYGDQGQPTVFDARCCRFLGVTHAELAKQVLAGGTDEEVLAWAEARGKPHTDEEYDIWNTFMSKRGWRDVAVPHVKRRVAEAGLEGKPVVTMFDFLDYDEGRDPAADRPWEKI
ncbi:MAG TPA: DUF5069 domain-containing protein [Lacunisphaera sp.]|nr:DUF5069 domain-containing protein [Lacunisphaera sp.]